VSTLRIGAGRYVIQAWPALLLLAAFSLVTLGERLAALSFQLSRRGRAIVGAAPAVLAVLYTYVALARVEPYPLDYFNEVVGGPSGVAARKMFEVPWWGEGNLAAVRALNRDAARGASVHLTLWPAHTLERLRDDLVPVEDATTADYVLVSHLQYVAKPPDGCTLTGSIDVAGAPLVDSYHCTPVSPAQLGFGAMSRGATDEAIGHFAEALRRDAQDPGAMFGMGWAAQVKGSLPRAESLYVAAAARAAQTGDLETEFFARFDLGTLYAQEGRSGPAENAFRATLVVIDRAPSRFADRSWSVWFNLGKALAAQGREAEARSALLQALSLRPGEPALVDALRALVPPADAGADVTSSGRPSSPPRR
jgi:tetratricopeptide (TPR) repeat protein